MRMRIKFARTFLALSVGGSLLGLVTGAGGAAAREQRASAVLQNASGQTVGTVRLVSEGNAVLMRTEVRGLTPGFHGFHVHSVGNCTPPSFTSAGGHFNPGGTGHGDHAGDLPSLLVMADGTAWLRFQTDRFTIEDLFDADGSAVIVHADRDNYAHIPTRYQSTTEGTFGPDSATLATGDAGARFACGVISSGRDDDD
jgi:superoxide dismutase, Cu-Zn family